MSLGSGQRRDPSPALPQNSLVVLVGVELAVPAGEGVAALTEQYEGLVLVNIAVHCALAISGLGWPWEMGTLRREPNLSMSNSGPHFLPVLQPWATYWENPGALQPGPRKSTGPRAQALPLKTSCPKPDQETTPSSFWHCEDGL